MRPMDVMGLQSRDRTMGYQRQVPHGFILFLLVLPAFQAGCSGGSSNASSSDISRITESSSTLKNIVAAVGGTVTLGEFTATFPAAALPGDARIKASAVSVSNSTQDSSLIDMTGT